MAYNPACNPVPKGVGRSTWLRVTIVRVEAMSMVPEPLLSRDPPKWEAINMAT